MILELGKRKCMNKKIVELRNKLGVSRVAFAKDLGSSATQMKRMEIGTVIPDDEFIQKICSTYHVNPAY